MKALLVDGPMRGQIMDFQSPVITVAVPGLKTMNKIPYYIHRFYLFGQVLYLASVSIDTEDIQRGYLMDLLLSDEAKQVLVGNTHGASE